MRRKKPDIETFFFWLSVLLLTLMLIFTAAVILRRERQETDVCKLKVIAGKTPVFYNECRAVMQTWAAEPIVEAP